MRFIQSRRRHITTPGHVPMPKDTRRRRPAELVALTFAATVGVGTLLLMLPASSRSGSASFLEALFTATSATCVTGLAVVDTATYWSPLGQGVILGLIQIGGFGVMAMASLFGLLVSRRLGLHSKLIAAASTRASSLGGVRSLLLGLLKVTLVVEATVAALIAIHLNVTTNAGLGPSIWSGIFHSISAFNNAGFSLYSDSLASFVSNPWMCLPLSAAVIIGGIGFPVVLEVVKSWRRPSLWSMHAKITVIATGALLTAAPIFFLISEWANPATMGRLSPGGKLLAAFTQGVMPRTAGFNSLDTSQMNTGTWMGTDVLMFIGGGSAGTAGGIKVGTFAILGLVIWSELRGDPDVAIFGRRISRQTQRQALAVALLSVAVVIIPTIVISATSRWSTDQVLFEVISAYTTTGLSTGITADLAPGHQLILVALMYIGRLGPVSLGTALALRERRLLYRVPESTALVG